MKNIKVTLDKKSQILLKSLIGTKLLFLKHQSLWTDSKTSPRVGVLTDKGILGIDIKEGKVGSFFGPKMKFPQLRFLSLQREEELDENREIPDFRRFPVKEEIQDILLVNETVLTKEGFLLESTEGIVLKTPAIEYAFYKSKPTQGTDIEILADSDVLPLLRPLEKRWFGLPKENLASSKRELFSLSTGEAKSL